MPETRYASAADGARIAFDSTGSGPPLVLLHGITQRRAMFDPLIPRLAEDRQVIAVDLRGHGESDDGGDYGFDNLAADIAAVVDEVGVSIGDVDVIGHSLGGVVATSFACYYSPRRVVNVDQPLALADFQTQVEAIETQLRGSEFEATMLFVLDSMTGDVISGAEKARIGSLQAPDQQVVLSYWTPLLDAAPDDLAATVDQILAGVTAPYLAIHGIDPGPDYADWLTTRVPTATVEVWPDLGHYPHLVEADRFLARVAEFLR